MLGTITRLEAGHGFIRSEDGVSYFFMPSGVQMTSIGFDDMTVGTGVEFVSIVHPRGPRAIEVRAVRGAAPTVDLADGNQ